MGKEKKTGIKSILLAFIGFAAFVLLDQYTKFLAVIHLKDQKSFVLIDGVFQLHYLENREALHLECSRISSFFVAGALIILVLLFLSISVCLIALDTIPYGFVRFFYVQVLSAI